MTDTPKSELPKSDLIDLVHHEHDHMTKLFGDLRATFEQLGQATGPESEKREMVETAQEDLRAAFDELLHHFDQEEEVFFVRMETRFPELGPQIATLVETHEFVCERTRWLQRVLQQGVDAITVNLDGVRDTLSTLQTTLFEHTNTENEIFGAALRRMTPQERESLLREMRELG